MKEQRTPTPEELAEHRRRQVWALTEFACDAYRRHNIDLLAGILESLTRVQQSA